MSQQPLNIAQIRTRFTKEKPKFIGLKNERGKWAVTMNSPKMPSTEKMKQIEKYFEKESTPDGLYYFFQKETLSKDAPETETKVVKGKVTADMLEDRQPVATSPMRTENVWNVQEAVKHLSDNERLKIQIKAKEEEIERLKSEAALQKKQLQDNGGKEDDELEPDNSKSMVESLKGLSEILSPIADRYFDTENRKLDLKEKQLAIVQRRRQLQTTATQNGQKLRPDGGLFVDDPAYEDYFAQLYNAEDDEPLNRELDMLEQHEPELYAELLQKYPMDADDGQGN